MTHFRTTRRVEFCDTDLAGIVHFANFYRYMEQAEHAFFRALGLKIHGRLADGTEYGWPRVAASCSFHSPAFYEQIIEIRISIVRRSPRSLTNRYEFYRGETRLADGEMKIAFCVFPPEGPMRSADLPEEIASVLDTAAAGTEPLRDTEGLWDR
ncbi:MAG TPA: thioesterase family protein [Planctomycetaceae bacterium]|nr:thioesterase family protein [Planctomycetaceae bacterium]